MRALTYRSNAHPAHIERQERRRAQAATRRTIEGQKVHLSGRSMWRGYWFGKGAIAKWNRAEQVLSGMKWSYFTGKPLQISHVSLLDAHHAAGNLGLKEVAAEKNDGKDSSSHMPRHAEGITRTNPDCQMQEEAGHTHGMHVESAHPNSHFFMQDTRRFEAQNSVDFGTSIERDHVDRLHLTTQTAHGIPKTADVSAPDSNAGVPAISIPSSASNPISLNMETAPVSDDALILQIGFDAASAPKATQAAGTEIPPVSNNTPAIPVFSDAVSLAIGVISRIARHSGFGAKPPGRSAADGMRKENGNNPDSATASTSAHLSSSSILNAQGQCAFDNITGIRWPKQQYAPNDGIQKRRGVQLKVARADAFPPQ
ncbi:MAG: hypothetical protein V1861_00935 [Candidatus Micrarchaeota archaeon]